MTRHQKLRLGFNLFWSALGLALAFWGFFHSLRAMIFGLWFAQGASLACISDQIRGLRGMRHDEQVARRLTDHFLQKHSTGDL